MTENENVEADSECWNCPTGPRGEAPSKIKNKKKDVEESSIMLVILRICGVRNKHRL
jgi:hypothetical protein